jgi:hypothetical protein
MSVLLVICLNIVSSCIHDKLYLQKKDIYKNSHLRKMIQQNPLALKSNQAEFLPIRIKFVYIDSTNINKTYYNPPLDIIDTDDPILKIFETEYLKPIADYYQSLLKVYSRKNKIFLNDGICSYFEPTEYKNGFDNVDLLILYTFEYNDEYYRARSQPCFIDPEYYNRPTTGIIFFNIKHFKNFDKVKPEDKLSISITIRHELIHMLGMTPFLYNKYVDDYGIPYMAYDEISINNNKLPILNTPRLTKYVKEYYNCNNINGMLLEKTSNNSTSISHFERTIIQNELMTGSSIYNHRIMTNFTLKLLEDTGWYVVNYDYATNTLWGRNKGCAFINTDCNKYCEFCKNKNEVSCDYGNQFISICSVDPLSSCMYYYGLQSCEEKLSDDDKVKSMVNNIVRDNMFYFGRDSKCIETKRDGKIEPRCQKTECDIDNKLVIISIMDQVIKCNTTEARIIKEGIVGGNVISIKCPYYERICFREDKRIILSNDFNNIGNIVTSSMYHMIIVLIFLF